MKTLRSVWFAALCAWLVAVMGAPAGAVPQ
jgi:hypothetical protein